MDIKELTQLVVRLRAERNWRQLNAKEMALGIITEAGELLHELRWYEEEHIEDVVKEKKEILSDEMGDILFCLLATAEISNIDLEQAFLNKLKKIEQKYPPNTPSQ